MLKGKLSLDTYTTQLLGKLLETSNKSTNLPFPSKQNTSSKNILNTLDFVYHNPNLFHTYFPVWLYNFLEFKPSNREKKIEFVNNYGSILKFKHLITNFNDNNGNQLYAKYKTSWNTQQSEFYRRIIPIKIDSKTDDLLSLNFVENPHSSKLTALRNQYAAIFKNKIKPPELTIKVFPDKFGHPPHPIRIFNMRLNRLIKLQNYFKKNPGISKEDMDALKKVDLHTLNGTTREAYVNFLQAAVVIQDNGDVQRSVIFEKRVASSAKLEDLYNRVRE